MATKPDEHEPRTRRWQTAGVGEQGRTKRQVAASVATERTPEQRAAMAAR